MPAACLAYEGDVTITKIIGSNVFVEQTNRGFAAKVTNFTSPPPEGTTIHLVGDLQITDHIRSIVYTSHTLIAPKSIKPLAMNMQTVLYSINGRGANIYGMKIRIWGVVSKTLEQENGYYVVYLNYANSIYRGENQPTGFKVLVNRQAYDSYTDGQMLTLTGILDADYSTELNRNLPKLWLE